MNKQAHRPLAVGALRTFEALARHLNFRAVGEELHVTQSAVSRQIRALEDEIGTPLFVRGTRNVAITEAGTQLLRVVLPLLDRLDATVRQIRYTGGRKSVSVTTFASLTSGYLRLTRSPTSTIQVSIWRCGIAYPQPRHPVHSDYSAKS